MKKLAILVAVAGFVLAAPVALAGDYHAGTELVCSDCHTMHYSQSHTYAGGDTSLVPAGGPFTNLLRYSETDLCLSCHDGKASAPDVMGNNTTNYVRQAGALNKPGGVDGYAETDGHTLGSTDVPPGGTWTGASDGFRCTDCHSAHGSKTFRNLKSKTGTATNADSAYVMCAVGTNVTSRDVFELVGNSDAGSASHYGIGNVWFNEPDSTKSRYGVFCKGCHTDFHGSATTNGTDWVRHPTANVSFSSSITTQYNAHANKVKVMGPTDDGNALRSATPSCMSCHKAHGNDNPFGLIFMSGTGTVTEEGDTDAAGVRDLCRQCHNKGAAL